MSNNGYDPLDMLTMEQAGNILQVQARTIRDYIKRYNLRHVKRAEGHKKPHKLYIMRQDLEQFIFNEWNNHK